MNRKQKKAKRLRATQHTKQHHELNLSQVQPVVFNRQSAEACLAQKDVFNTAVHEIAKKKFKTKMIIGGLVLWVVWILALIW